MATLLQKIALHAFRHRLRFLAAWMLVLLIAVGSLAGLGSTINSEFTIPGSSSQRALDTLAKTLPAAAGTSAQVVFEAPAGHRITDSPYRAGVEATLARTRTAPQVSAVTDPFQSKTISRDGRTALAQVRYPVSRTVLESGTLPALEQTVAPAKQAGLDVQVGGSAYGSGQSKPGPNAATGLVIALVILFITFGSLVAAGMPLLVAISSTGLAVVGLYLVSNATTVSSTAPSLAMMIGLAVGIDYSLFILSRYRSELAAGRPPEEAAGVAAGTAGSAVVFAGVTVLIALAGLSLAGIPFLTVMGLGAAVTVAVAVLAAHTLLPAIFGLLGHRLAPKPGSRAARREKPGTAAVVGERWARFVTRHPLRILAVGVLALLVLAIPALSMHLALADNSTAAPGSSQRTAYDVVATEFGPGFNGPLTLLVQANNPTKAAGEVATTVKALPDVLAISAPQLGTDGHTAVLSVIPKSGPHDEATTNLVRTIRDQAPDIADTTAAQVSVTGPTAVAIDVSDRLSASLLPFAALVVGLSLILLLVVFRSIIVPIKAAAGFLLSIGATLGAVVAVFQWGWLANLLGVSATGPVISFLPIILIAVLFGLAMDYEVFMVSRIREAFVHGAEPDAAVIRGGRNATRVVTAAALIMFSVFAGFVGTPDATLKTIAFGLGFGVFVDAFAVRMTLVPAVLALVGRRAWSLPAWLDRVLPDLDIEGAKLHVRPVPPAPARDEASPAVTVPGTTETPAGKPGH